MEPIDLRSSSWCQFSASFPPSTISHGNLSVQSDPDNPTTRSRRDQPFPLDFGLPPVQEIPAFSRKGIDRDEYNRSPPGYRPSTPDPGVGPLRRVVRRSRVTVLRQEFFAFDRSCSPQPPVNNAAETSAAPYYVRQQQQQQQEPIWPRVNSSDVRSPIWCAVCLDSFPTPELLERHSAQQHAGHSVGGGAPDRPFLQCDLCSHTFRYRSGYLKHREVFHPVRSAIEKPFLCDVCGSRYTHLKSFRKHQVLKHERPVDGSTGSDHSDGRATATPPPSLADDDDSCGAKKGGKSLLCSFCGRWLQSNQSLKLHVRAHTGERPFACEHCKRAFSGRANLLRHRRMHTGQKPFLCDKCGTSFTRRASLSKHLRTVCYDD